MHKGLIQPVQTPIAPVTFSFLSSNAKVNSSTYGAGVYTLPANVNGFMVVNASAGNVGLSLPVGSAMSGVPEWYVISREDATANSVTYSCTAPNVFATGATVYSVNPYATCVIIFDGINTWTISDNTSAINQPALGNNSSSLATTAFVVNTLSASGVVKDSSTGSAQLPAGTTAQRTASPTPGRTRFNLDTGQTEGWNGVAWVSLGGATGGGSDQVFYLNGQTVNYPYTVPAGQNAHSVGPLTVATGVTVTVSAGSTWTVL